VAGILQLGQMMIKFNIFPNGNSKIVLKRFAERITMSCIGISQRLRRNMAARLCCFFGSSITP